MRYPFRVRSSLLLLILVATVVTLLPTDAVAQRRGRPVRARVVTAYGGPAYYGYYSPFFWGYPGWYGYYDPVYCRESYRNRLGALAGHAARG